MNFGKSCKLFETGRSSLILKGKLIENFKCLKIFPAFFVYTS